MAVGLKQKLSPLKVFYFSITPQGSATDGIVGFNRDDEYIGGFLGRLIAKKFCVPEIVKSIQDMDMFWDTTINFIKQAKKLRFVSIWNPTFLLIMLEKANMRAKELFPHLEVISCWADGNSAVTESVSRRLHTAKRAAGDRRHYDDSD